MIRIKKIIFTYTLVIPLIMVMFTMANATEMSTTEALKRLDQRGVSSLEKALYLRNQNKLFLSSMYLKDHIAEINQGRELSSQDKNRTEALLRYLIQMTGASTFKSIPRNQIERITLFPSLNYIKGLQDFDAQRYERALNIFGKVDNEHPFSPEVKYKTGTILQILNRTDEALKTNNECIEIADNYAQNSRRTEQQRYYVVLKEKCTMNTARIKYERGEYRKAIEWYDKIPKTSYRWPYTLLEKAWAFHKLEDFNRSLGLLVTYHSPLMQSYFFPEAEVLRALNYLKLCLYNDTESVIQQYYQVYRPRSERLHSIITRNEGNPNFYIQLTTSDLRNGNNNPFIRNLTTQVQKQIKYSVELVSYQRSMREFRQLQSEPDSELKTKLLTELSQQIQNRSEYFNHYIKSQFYEFINQIHGFSYEMFNIRLEIMGSRRNLIYDNKELISDRSRGSYENVRRSSNEHFFDFRGEFWADELGDYSFGLKSNCERVELNTLSQR